MIFLVALSLLVPAFSHGAQPARIRSSASQLALAREIGNKVRAYRGFAESGGQPSAVVHLRSLGPRERGEQRLPR